MLASPEETDEIYFDISCGPAEVVVESIAKVAAGLLVALFSLHELMDELSEYRTLRQKKKVTND